ncbi:MAG: carboxypeptidase regulatory-like domain-containing protein [Gemmatimonadaceae bacterium]
MAVLAFGDDAVAQATATRQGALAGVVSDSVGAPIRFATLVVDGLEISSITDDSGRFHLATLPAHEITVGVVRLGYRPVAFSVTILADTTIVVAIRLRRVQILQSVEATAVARSRRFRATGFESRQHLGLGTFVSPERVDSVAKRIFHASEYLRDARGIELRKSSRGYSVIPRRDPKCLWLFVDGTYFHTEQLDDHVAPDQVYAMELYERPTIVPTEFQGRLPMKSSVLTVAGGCGALVVWTKARQ